MKLITMPGQFEVMIERNFSSAHQLRGYKGKCENLHGHNYKIEIYARGSELNNIGLLVDFVKLKEAADDLVTYLDHTNLNELEPFVVEQNPSAENVARFDFNRRPVWKVQLDRHRTFGSRQVAFFDFPVAHHERQSQLADVHRVTGARAQVLNAAFSGLRIAQQHAEFQACFQDRI